jgi:hypothetical protein
MVRTRTAKIAPELDTLCSRIARHETILLRSLGINKQVHKTDVHRKIVEFVQTNGLLVERMKQGGNVKKQERMDWRLRLPTKQ